MHVRGLNISVVHTYSETDSDDVLSVGNVIDGLI